MGRTNYFLIFKENKFVCVLTVYWHLVSSVNYLCLWQKERGRAAPLH